MVGKPELAELNIMDGFYFQWHITERCNWSCKHCYQNGNRIDDLPIGKLLEIYDRMEEAVKKWGKTGTISLTGGEPFLRAEELHELMSRLDGSDSFAYYDILTNGSMVGKKEAAVLSKHKKLRRVQVSLEGATPESNDAIRGQGSFDAVSNTIMSLREQDIAVSVMMTITRKNRGEIPALVEILGRMGVQALALERFVPEGNGIGMKDLVLNSHELQDLYEKIYKIAVNGSPVRILLYRPLFNLVGGDDPTVGALCSAGNNALTIMPDGTVYPCRRLPIPIGNVLADGLYKIWYGSDVLWTLRDPKNLKGKCHDCASLTRCRGCRAMAYFTTGDYMAEDPAMLEVDQSAEFVLSEDILLKAFPESSQYYAFDTKNGDHFNLNATAHWVLDRITHGNSLGLLTASFATEFGLNKEDALKDLMELIESALENKIITRRHNNEEKENV